MNGVIKVPAALVPAFERDVLDKLSKAHLMDLVWSLAGRLSSSCDDREVVMHVLREESLIVAHYRGDESLGVVERRYAKRVSRRGAA